MNALVIESITGKTISQLARIHYDYRGQVATDRGALQLTFSDGTIVVLDSASDGDSLSVRPGPWSDPFAEPLSAVNHAFVEEHGKWSIFGQADDPVFGQLIGAEVVSVTTTSSDGIVVGAGISLRNFRIEAVVAGDDLYVHVLPVEA